MSSVQRYGPPFQAGIFTVMPAVRKGRGIDNKKAVPMDTILLDRKLREAVEDEAQRIAVETNRVYGFYRSIKWVYRRSEYVKQLKSLGNFKPANWRMAQAYVVSRQDNSVRRASKQAGLKREEGTVYIEKKHNLARNALIRVTSLRLER